MPLATLAAVLNIIVRLDVVSGNVPDFLGLDILYFHSLKAETVMNRLIKIRDFGEPMKNLFTLSTGTFSSSGLMGMSTQLLLVPSPFILHNNNRKDFMNISCAAL